MAGSDGKKVVQYDISAREKRLVEDRARLRSSLKAEYTKQVTSPYKYLTHGDGGYIFDPSMQRWISMRAQQWHYFKPSPKNFLLPAFVVFSCWAAGHWFHVRRTADEARYRRGEISYRDREFKFV